MLTVCAGALILNPAVHATEPAEKNDPGFLQKMEQWQDKMSDMFRDTWKSLRGDSKENSVATASVDLREDKNNYTVRLNLPDRKLDKVEINLEGDTLRILAPAEDKAGRYEQEEITTKKDEGKALHRSRKAAYSQMFTLPGPVQSEKMNVDQKESMLVVTLPKAK